MRKRHFYSHLVEFESIYVALQEVQLSSQEREHLVSVAESSLHHVVMDAILSELSEGDKKTFLKHLAGNNHEKIWEFLNGKVNKIEDKIKKAAEELKKELHRDIKKRKFKAK
ncbi:MAG: hypothetical protein UW69_C0036G0008 [Microgenomates group bacterium GW2011_GWA2_44_7]|nr:MAG: hypothetical protein UW69_C0036G0008 [Microgenomates group bacterium GW2011_GWA2_44_7]KKT78248.1 MAG: hypothetical protein UW73_C0005G0073 [Microgenomates group bacterium GW2011_GWB1_44_8]